MSNKKDCVDNDKISRSLRKSVSFTNFRAEKRGVYIWGDNKLIDFLVNWVGTQKCFPLIYCKFIIAPAAHATFFLLPPKGEP